MAGGPDGQLLSQPASAPVEAPIARPANPRVPLNVFKDLVAELEKLLSLSLTENASDFPSVDTLLNFVNQYLISRAKADNSLSDPMFSERGNLAKVLRNALNNIIISDTVPKFREWIKAELDKKPVDPELPPVTFYFDDHGEVANGQIKDAKKFSQRATTIFNVIAEVKALSSGERFQPTSILDALKAMPVSFPRNSKNPTAEQAAESSTNSQNEKPKLNIPAETWIANPEIRTALAGERSVYLTKKGTVTIYQTKDEFQYDFILDSRTTAKNTNVSLAARFIGNEFRSFIYDHTLRRTGDSGYQSIIAILGELSKITEPGLSEDEANSFKETRGKPLEAIINGFMVGIEVMEEIYDLADLQQAVKDILADPEQTEKLIGLLRNDSSIGSTLDQLASAANTDATMQERLITKALEDYLEAVATGEFGSIGRNTLLMSLLDKDSENTNFTVYRLIDSLIGGIIAQNFNLPDHIESSLETMRKSYSGIPLALAQMHILALGLARVGGEQIDRRLIQDQVTPEDKLKLNAQRLAELEQISDLSSPTTMCPAIVGGSIDELKSLLLEVIAAFVDRDKANKN